MSDVLVESRAHTEIEFTPIKTNIDNELAGQELNPEQTKLMRELTDFLDDVSSKFKEQFWHVMDRKSMTRPEISARIKQFILEHGFDVPYFRIMGREAGENYLQQVVAPEYLHPEHSDEEDEREYKIGDDSVMMIFDLPKPVAQYWKKAEGGPWSRGLPEKNVGPEVVPWGYFYRRMIDTVRKAVDAEDREGKLHIRRIRSVAHAPLQHYYIFEVSRWPHRDEPMLHTRLDIDKVRQTQAIRDVLNEYLEEEPVD